MTDNERLTFCQVCTKRLFDPEKGIVCSLTGEKPAFEETCENYDEDVAAVTEREKKNEEAKKPAEISGFFAFYLFWAIPIGVVVSLISFFINFNASDYSGSSLLPWFDITFILFYAYFGAYTIYAFVKRKSDAVFIGKYQLILLFASNLLVLLLGATGDGFMNNVSRVVTSIIWSIVFFIFLCSSEDVKDRIPKETRKLSPLNKVLFILSIILPIFFFIGGVYQIAVKDNFQTTLQQVCEQNRQTLPQEVSQDVLLTDMSYTPTTFVYDYEYTGDTSLFPEGHLEMMEDFGKEGVLFRLGDLIKDDPLFPLLQQNGYNLLFRYSDSAKRTLYSFMFTNAELAEASAPGYAHQTDSTVFKRIISNYSKCLPYELLEDCDVTGMRLSGDNLLRCEILLKNLGQGVLPGLTSSYLKDYMKDVLPYMADAPLQLAQLNQMPISFDFRCDRNDWWRVSAVFSPEDYASLAVSTEE